LPPPPNSTGSRSNHCDARRSPPLPASPTQIGRSSVLLRLHLLSEIYHYCGRTSAHQSCLRSQNKAICRLASMATNENLPPNVIRQLAKELKNLDQSPPEGIRVIVNDDDFTSICADIDGPGGTPYENGVFRMKLVLSRDFPQSPPKGIFCDQNIPSKHIEQW
uniref:UBC core domain-containing protein n=1 Tax=Aegilops tauschii subsp. strangulata TaxID=200361 RepID=A0A453NJB2_AEGTS